MKSPVERIPSRLIIYLGDNNPTIPDFHGRSFLYRIGAGGVLQGEFEEVNNAARLNLLALELRDTYSDWIYSLNESCLKRGLKLKELSLFLISDCSAKRTELFPTYSVFCNLQLIREIIEAREPNQILIVNGTLGWKRSLKSIAKKIPVKMKARRRRGPDGFRRLVSDLRFLLQLGLVIFQNKAARNSGEKTLDVEKKRLFFSIYPKMVDESGCDRKYGEMAGGADSLAVSILTDGLHQHVTVKEFFEFRRRIIAKGARVIDDYLNYRDLMKGVYWVCTLRLKTLRLGAAMELHNIDLSSWVAEEIGQSASRVGRFMVIKGGFEKFFDSVNIDEFVYYLHEYPLGRLISWVLATNHPDVIRIGFQHGPCAWRKMVYALSSEEVAHSPNFLYHVPIPNKVLAEDLHSAKVYRYSGYSNVELMERIYRLDYLKDIVMQEDADISLVAAGLNDGLAIIQAVLPEIRKHPQFEYRFKPHPLANNKYLAQIELPKNCQITHSPVYQLMPRVKTVYVSYSSVGYEASLLGISVHLIDIPGRINESSLMDIARSRVRPRVVKEA